MAQRRVLPPRANRGKRPQQSQQQIAKDNVTYNHFFEMAQNQSAAQEANQRPKPIQRVDSAQIEFEHKQHLIVNKVFFPYARGYHYYFDLASFPRVEGSVSYASDQNNVFHATYVQQDKVIRDDLTVGKLFNRKLFGLPIADPVHMPQTKDKNICHSYLFQNEDRKFYIDRSMYELKQMLLHFDRLEETGLIKAFSCLKKDIDLLSILEDDISVDEKKNILKKKIKILMQKKQSMKNFLITQDRNFFYNSLNQKLHDQIEQMGALLSFDFILGEISYAEHLRDELKGCQQFKGSQLTKLFKYYQTQRFCLKEQTIKQISQKIGPSFFQKSESENIFEITVPFVFFTFANNNIMTVCEKVLALRLAQQDQASFYICKIFWKRVFGRDLFVNKELKPMAKIDYDKAMAQAVLQLSRWKKSKEKQGKKDDLIYPQLDSLVNLNVFDSNSTDTDLFSRQKEIQINARQYICLALFYNLYLCLSQIYEFVLNNQNISTLIANDFYCKAHNYLVQCIGTARFGILDEVLKKLSECIIRPDFEINFKLKWIYNENLGVAYVIKTGLESEWETQKEDNEDEDGKEEEQIVQDSNEKKIK